MSADGPLKPLRYAKVGGPPRDWHGLLAVDVATGDGVHGVIEVDCDAGWLVRYRYDESGAPLLNETRDEILTERVEGRFLLVR